MNEQGSADAESAYGSEISSNSNVLIKRDRMEGLKAASQFCYHWQNKLREYMVPEAVFFLTLVFLFTVCNRITSQNQETQRMVLSIQSKLNWFQKQTTTKKDFMNIKQETETIIKNEHEEIKSMLEEVLKEVRIKSRLQLEAIQSIINSTTNSKETNVPQLNVTVSTNSTHKLFNAANLVFGSRIDSSLSSSSSLNPFFGFDQSSLVLVDRPEPPANKLWCTFEKNPVLTVELGNYINPAAVSYQHSKWIGTIPDDAPKVYSVAACLDKHCMTRKPIFSSCEYNLDGSQEQICNNFSNHSIKSTIGKLQFLFHRNHGNTERTCVSLVRVYSETTVAPEQKLRRLEDTTTCLDLNHYYHHSPMIYKFFTFKNCNVLLSKGCCQECPECCDECEIKDTNPDVTLKIIFFCVLYPLCAIILLSTMFFCKPNQK